MKKITALFFLVFTLGLVKTMPAQTATISVFAPNEFAIKGDIERQVEKAADRIKKQSADGTGATITVVGYADHVGTGPINDRIGQLRAEEAKNFFAAKLPKATIVAYSGGLRKKFQRDYRFMENHSAGKIDVTIKKVVSSGNH